jgi:hypothetical protein
VTDHCRPLLLGYVRADALTTPDKLAMAEANLAAFAATEGFTLGTVYVERDETAPGAFHALMDEVLRNEDAWAVVVPDVTHLDPGRPYMTQAHRHDFANVSVLVADLFP